MSVSTRRFSRVYFSGFDQEARKCVLPVIPRRVARIMYLSPVINFGLMLRVSPEMRPSVPTTISLSTHVSCWRRGIGTSSTTEHSSLSGEEIEESQLSLRNSRLMGILTCV
jgi:hypothetical protein